MIHSIPDTEARRLGRHFVETIAAYFGDSLDFASQDSSQSKQCSKGYSCKRTCISKDLECDSPLTGQAKVYAGWLELQIQAGNRVFVAGGSSNEKASTQPLTVESLANGEFKDSTVAGSKVALPADVSVRKRRSETEYSFNAGDSEVTVYFSEDRSGISVSFDVDGDTVMSNLPQAQKNVAALKVLRVMRYDASQREDGAKYFTSAESTDQAAIYRAQAYNRIAGFSIPVNGKPGAFQYGVVKNGRVVPDVDEWKADQEKNHNKLTDEEMKSISDKWKEITKVS